MTLDGVIPGTTAYMSPEQVRGEEIDARSDLFSVGVVLYEMATGTRPFAGKNRVLLMNAILNAQPCAPSQLNRALPTTFDSIVARSLEKDRNRRYQHASEIRNELQRLKQDLDLGRSTPTLGEATLAAPPKPLSGIPGVAFSKFRVRRLWMLFPVALAVLALIAGGFFLVKRSHDASWARKVALPEISRLSDQGKFDQAYALALKAEKSIPDDPVLTKLWLSVSYLVSIDSTPPGADVYRRTTAMERTLGIGWPHSFKNPPAAGHAYLEVREVRLRHGFADDEFAIRRASGPRRRGGRKRDSR